MSLGFIFAKKEFAELLSVVEDNQLFSWRPCYRKQPGPLFISAPIPGI